MTRAFMRFFVLQSMGVTRFQISQFIKSYRSGNPHAREILRGKIPNAKINLIEHRIGRPKPRSPPNSPTGPRPRIPRTNVTSPRPKPSNLYKRVFAPRYENNNNNTREAVLIPMNIPSRYRLENVNINVLFKLWLNHIRFNTPFPNYIMSELIRRKNKL
jgi:hypothetical protein